jgi:phospholipid/cholesterol/gamma-HCH transport system permease protein
MRTNRNRALVRFTLIFLTPYLKLFAFIRDSLISLGEVVVLLLRIFKRFPLVFKNPSITVKQMMSIGVSSIPLILVTSAFTGMVTTVQAEYQFRNFIPDKFIGTAVSKSVLIELGPVLTALVMAGRVGSALAAEIGSMKEKEELDAMIVLDLDPLRYLAMPRMLTFMIMIPCLTIFSMFVAILGGWVVSTIGLNITSYTYTSGLTYWFDIRDLLAGLTKSFVFGIIICLMGYHHGLTAGSGAKGVGTATMKTVVSSSLLILIFDFIIAILMFRN